MNSLILISYILWFLFELLVLKLLLMQKWRVILLELRISMVRIVRVRSRQCSKSIRSLAFHVQLFICKEKVEKNFTNWFYISFVILIFRSYPYVDCCRRFRAPFIVSIHQFVFLLYKIFCILIDEWTIKFYLKILVVFCLYDISISYLYTF